MAIAFDVASLDRLDRIHRPLIHDTYLTEYGIATISLTFHLTSERVTAARLDTEAERNFLTSIDVDNDDVNEGGGGRGGGIETYRLTRLDISRSDTTTTTTCFSDDNDNDDGGGGDGDNDDEKAWMNTCRTEYRRVVNEIRQSRNVELIERLDAFDRITIRVDLLTRTDALATVAALDLFVRWILLLSTFPIAPKDETKCFAIPFRSSRLWIFLDKTTWRKAIASSLFDPPTDRNSVVFVDGAMDSKKDDDDETSLRVFSVTDDISPNNINIDSRSVRRPISLSRVPSIVDLEREEQSLFVTHRTALSSRNIAAITSNVKLTPVLQQLTREQQETFDSVRDIFDGKSSQTTIDRRVVVDGVAGAGKTFMLSLLLKAYPYDGVIYLVKKRLFAQSIHARFANIASNLETYTVDAFLMRRLNIRSLDVWLELQRTGITELKRCAAESCRRNQENFRIRGGRRRRPIIFVDEFGQLEGTLTEILFELLRTERVVLVGDIYQQCAIGAPVDQPIRTLLAYNRVLFMYENVRARDPRLLERLSLFHRCTEDNIRISILNGLPHSAILSVGDFVRACSKNNSHCRSWRYLSQDVIALLPRVIVLSNENANFVNWMIGKSLWVHAPYEQRLRYKRAIRITLDTELPAEVIVDGSGETTTTTTTTVLDDPYADEHYVFVGLTHRLIRSVLTPYGILEAGTRIIITAIESTEMVKAIEAPTDNAVPSKTTALEFRVSKTLVQPYEYNSVWSRVLDGSARIFMFPFVMDVASTVYQMQGVTLPARRFARCYIDAKGMDDRALYVALSRFETQDQVRGIINATTATI